MTKLRIDQEIFDTLRNDKIREVIEDYSSIITLCRNLNVPSGFLYSNRIEKFQTQLTNRSEEFENMMALCHKSNNNIEEIEKTLEKKISNLDVTSLEKRDIIIKYKG
ncbi:MAG: hypothetical protein R3Y13_02560 [bacterium]